MTEDVGQTRKYDEVIKLIAAVAAGDADRRDVVSALKEKGVDTLDVLIEALIEVARRSQQEPPQYLDPRQIANAKTYRRSPEAVHPAPSRAFVLNGVLYDPADIARFNDRDLHFITGPSGGPIIVTDDLALITNWRQLRYLDSACAPQSQAFEPGIIPHTNFWENVGFTGDRLELAPGRAYARLSEVSRGFLGFGDWNDCISSIQLVGTRGGELWEHKNFQGSSGTWFQTDQLWSFGWDNRASACAVMY